MFHTHQYGRYWQLKKALQGVDHYKELAIDERRKLRQWLLCIDDSAKKSPSSMALAAKKYPILIVCAKILPPPPNTRLLGNRGGSLGLGPWYHDGLETHCIYRGRKIGKSDMTYSQGMAAQITAATAIGIASATGMPVSTTHVLSSAVAGTMVANRVGLQWSTVKTILLAWVFTLPATIALSAGLFYLGSLFI